MTRKEFEKATNELKDSVTENHYMFAELINGQKQCLLTSNGGLGFSTSWDDEMLYVSNMGINVASMPLAAIVRIVIK